MENIVKKVNQKINTVKNQKTNKQKAEKQAEVVLLSLLGTLYVQKEDKNSAEVFILPNEYATRNNNSGLLLYLCDKEIGNSKIVNSFKYKELRDLVNNKATYSKITRDDRLRDAAESIVKSKIKEDKSFKCLLQTYVEDVLPLFSPSEKMIVSDRFSYNKNVAKVFSLYNIQIKNFEEYLDENMQKNQMFYGNNIDFLK